MGKVGYIYSSTLKGPLTGGEGGGMVLKKLLDWLVHNHTV